MNTQLTVRISVIIPTYNRSESLRKTLQSLEVISVSSEITWELIIVDNNSADQTKKVIQETRQKQNLPLRYIFEAKQGVSHARNAGIEAANGEILAFTDDDCIVDRDWLLLLHQEFSADAALYGVGGRVELYDSRDKTVTIRPFRERIAFNGIDQLFYLIAGCNMAFRREVFDIVGRFDPDFSGTGGLVADDTDFIYRVFRHGFKIVYSPEVLIYHNHGRRTDEQIHALKKGYLRGRGGFYCKHVLAGDGDVLKMAYWEINGLLKGLLKKVCVVRSANEEACVIGNLAAGAAYELINKYRLSRSRSGL
jgi:glycosyltransferase involved in cell wall biosynthesis